jgi:phosphodiesterase/alkaline phosphatase D-like protein
VIRRHHLWEGVRRRVLFIVTAAVVSLALIGIPTNAAHAAVASELRRYPYLTDLVTSNVTINWATLTSLTTGSATYGRVGSESCTAHSVTATRISMTVGSTAEYQWKAQVSGLAPDATYCYRVFGGSVDLLGSDPSPQFNSQVAAGATTPF